MTNDDLIPYEKAAALIGVSPKRLLGYLIRNKVGDPIDGDTPDGIMVYGWSCKTLAERTPNHSTAATDTSAGSTTTEAKVTP